MISEFADIIIKSQIVKGDNVTIKTTPLDISKISGNIGFISKESNYARGYKKYHQFN
jgi:hypothetical protein